MWHGTKSCGGHWTGAGLQKRPTASPRPASHWVQPAVSRAKSFAKWRGQIFECPRQKRLQDCILAAAAAIGVAEFAAQREMAVSVDHRPDRNQQPLRVGIEGAIRCRAGGGPDRVFEDAKGCLGDADELRIAVV